MSARFFGFSAAPCRGRCPHRPFFSTPFPFLLQKRKRCRAAKGKEGVGKPSEWFPHAPSNGQGPCPWMLRRMNLWMYNRKRSTNGCPYIHQRKCDRIRRGGHCPPDNPSGAARQLPLHKGAFIRCSGDGRTGSSAPRHPLQKERRDESCAFSFWLSG